MYKSFNIGDKVCWIDQALEGTIVDINRQRAEVKLSDGFTEWIALSKLVLQLEDMDIDNAIDDKNELTHIEYRPLRTEEIDLHIEKLYTHWRSIPVQQILSRQINAFEEELRTAIAEKRDRLIVVHGKGEGILKANIIDILQKNYGYTYVEMKDGKYKNAAIEIFLNAKS